MRGFSIPYPLTYTTHSRTHIQTSKQVGIHTHSDSIKSQTLRI